jgi:hypothetical protein
VNEHLKIEIQKLDKKVNALFLHLLSRIDALQEKQKQPRITIGFRKEEP